MTSQHNRGILLLQDRNDLVHTVFKPDTRPVIGEVIRSLFFRKGLYGIRRCVSSQTELSRGGIVEAIEWLKMTIPAQVDWGSTYSHFSDAGGGRYTKKPYTLQKIALAVKEELENSSFWARPR